MQTVKGLGWSLLKSEYFENHKDQNIWQNFTNILVLHFSQKSNQQIRSKILFFQEILEIDQTFLDSIA